MHPEIENMRAVVRRSFPEAEVVPEGAFLFVVQSGAKRLGLLETTPARAWRSAYVLLKANEN